jgi:hypothetical protein
MKKLLALLVMAGISFPAFSQAESEPCCNVVGIDKIKNVVTVRNEAMGRLFQFGADAVTVNLLKVGAPVKATPKFDKVTSVNGAKTDFVVIRTYAEPVGAVTNKVNKAEPVGAVTTKINKAEPVGIASLPVHGAEPCCSVTDVQIDNAEPVGMLTARNKSTGKTFRFKAPALVLSSINVGDPAYLEPCCNMAIVQLKNNTGEVQSYGYYITSEEEADNKPWVINKLQAKSGTGKVFSSFPRGTEWSVTIYVAGTDKVLSNTMLQYSFALLPGSYDVEIHKVRINGVPVEKGNETRIKAGVLHITQATNWTLYDEKKEKVLVNSTTAQKRGMPVGKYMLSIMGQDQEIEIKDGETVVF